MGLSKLANKFKQYSSKIKNSIQKNGIKNTFLTIYGRTLFKKVGNYQTSRNLQHTIEDFYTRINDLYQDQQIKGLAIITSAMEFEEVYNQRTINLAKYYSENDYAVIYVTWQWDPYEKHEKDYQKVFKNIVQLPLFDFIYMLPKLNETIKVEDKSYFMTFPAEPFVDMIPTLRADGYNIVYDMMDEWEEFYKVGQASWFTKQLEEKAIKDSDLVLAVSKPLKYKYEYIRKDIIVLGNGYSKNVSGSKNISLKTEASDGLIHLGYFGHMTDSWFDWDIVFSLAEDDRYFIHLIGYGMSEELEKRVSGLSNMKYYGKVHPSQLEEFVRHWHVGMIPFQKSTLSEAVDPIKIYEYLYFGLPTVSSGIPHIGDYPLVMHCENAEDFKEAIHTMYQTIINGSRHDHEELESFLENATWEKRFQFIEEKLLLI